MSIKASMAAIVSALAAIAGAAPAHADGECYKDYRDTTSAERATIAALLEAAKKALPAASTGSVILGDDEIQVTQNLCRDVELSPWEYEFARAYQRTDDQKAKQDH